MQQNEADRSGEKSQSGEGFVMSLKPADASWKVSATDKTVSGRTWRHGFGFSIQDFRGVPLVSISYDTEKEAKEAESAIRKALEKAIDISTG